MSKVSKLLVVIVCGLILVCAGTFTRVTSNTETIPKTDFLDIEKIVSINIPGLVCGIQVEDDIAYVGDHTYGLKIFNVSNPENVIFIGETDDPGDVYHDIYVDSNRKMAYLAELDYGLVIFNISDLSNPTRIGDYKVGDYRASSIHADGELAYLATSVGLEILNVSNPNNPRKIGSYETENGSIKVQVINNIAYMSSGGTRLIILDVSDPTQPIKLGEYKDEDPVRIFYVDPDDNITIINEVDGIKVLDVSNLTNPEFLGEENDVRSLYTYGIYKKNDYAYIGEWEDGLAIVNVSDPTDPRVVNRYTEDGGVGWVFTANDMVFIGTINISTTVSSNFIILRIISSMTTETSETTEKTSIVSSETTGKTSDFGSELFLIGISFITILRRKIRKS